MSGAWRATAAANLSVHWMRPGSEWLSMREAVLTVSPIIVYLKFCAPTTLRRGVTRARYGGAGVRRRGAAPQQEPAGPILLSRPLAHLL